MIEYISSYGLVKALEAEGFALPKEVCDMKLLIPVDGLYQLQYVVNLDTEDLKKLARAFIREAEQRTSHIKPK